MTAQTLTLTDFLLARIAEIEAVARGATPGPWYADDFYSVVTAEPFKSAREAYDRTGDEDCWVIPESMDSGVARHNLDHIARHDPARVLAECEAKRRIVEDALDHAEQYRIERTPTREGMRWAAMVAVGQLAAAYADHPDYREEWKP